MSGRWSLTCIVPYYMVGSSSTRPIPNRRRASSVFYTRASPWRCWWNVPAARRRRACSTGPCSACSTSSRRTSTKRCPVILGSPRGAHRLPLEVQPGRVGRRPARLRERHVWVGCRGRVDGVGGRRRKTRFARPLSRAPPRPVRAGGSQSAAPLAQTSQAAVDAGAPHKHHADKRSCMRAAATLPRLAKQCSRCQTRYCVPLARRTTGAAATSRSAEAKYPAAAARNNTTPTKNTRIGARSGPIAPSSA